MDGGWTVGAWMRGWVNGGEWMSGGGWIGWLVDVWMVKWMVDGWEDGGYMSHG